jgi:hypothetical protein
VLCQGHASVSEGGEWWRKRELDPTCCVTKVCPYVLGVGGGRTTRSDGEEDGGVEIYKDEMELIEVIERPLGRTYFSR